MMLTLLGREYSLLPPFAGLSKRVEALGASLPFPTLQPYACSAIRPSETVVLTASIIFFLNYNPHTVQASAGGSEPSDAVRAVNALLTQLDGLKRFPNAMVLTTSNITVRW